MPSPFVTHGIDVIADPEAPKQVFIFAVNHPPALCWSSPEGCTPDEPKENATIEVFMHTLGSSTAAHIQSIRDPLIRTPNDILARNPNQFWVTNDHKYDSGMMRMIEDSIPVATWSDTITVARQVNGKIKAQVALEGLHNNNGLGLGPTNLVAIGSAASGQLHLAVSDPTPDRKLTVTDSVRVPSCIDNPSYFTDPMALDGDDASGYILAGLSKAHQLGEQSTDPSARVPTIVWHVRKVGGKWKKQVLFEDDGSRISTASAAVCVAGEDWGEKGDKDAWCFVTGFLSKNMIAFKADLGW
jgi:hypothetical protein